MGTATFIRQDTNDGYDTKVFRLDPPLTESDCVLVSALAGGSRGNGIDETFVFASDENGNIRSFSINGDVDAGMNYGTLDHAEALAKLGYEVA